MDDRYSVLIKFDNQDSADSFYEYFNGRRFNSLEVCFTPNVLLLFTLERLCWRPFLCFSRLHFPLSFSPHFYIVQVEICRILYTVDVQYTGYKGSVENIQTSPMSSIEQPSCPVCLGICFSLLNYWCSLAEVHK